MAEILARLAPKTQRLQRGIGGEPELTIEDISGALAGLPREPYLFGRAAFAGDATVLPELIDRVDVRLKRLIEDPPPDLALFLVRCAIAPPVCPTCQGRRYMFERAGRVTECPRCTEHGPPRVGVKATTRALHIGRARWRAIEPAAKQIETLLWRWRALVIGHVLRQIRSAPD